MPPNPRARGVLDHLLLDDIIVLQTGELSCTAAKIFEELRERRSRLERLTCEVVLVAERTHAAVAEILAKFEALEWQRGERTHEFSFFRLRNEVRLIPPAYVKPFVKRQKNDAIDAEAICEAAQRPSMRLAAVKSEQQQAAGLVFRTRDR